MKKVLKLTEVAQHLGIPIRTIYDMLKDGRFSVSPIPGTKPRLWNLDDVEKWRSGGSNDTTN